MVINWINANTCKTWPVRQSFTIRCRCRSHLNYLQLIKWPQTDCHTESKACETPEHLAVARFAWPIIQPWQKHLFFYLKMNSICVHFKTVSFSVRNCCSEMLYNRLKITLWMSPWIVDRDELIYDKEIEEQRKRFLCSKCLRCVGWQTNINLWLFGLDLSLRKANQSWLTSLVKKTLFCELSIEKHLGDVEGRGTKLAWLRKHGLLDMSGPYGWVKNEVYLPRTAPRHLLLHLPRTSPLSNRYRRQANLIWLNLPWTFCLN